MGRIEDLGLVADKGLEWKAKCEAATAECDQLRAEVRSAKKKISVMGGEWMAEAKRAVAAEEKLSAATARAEVAEGRAEGLYRGLCDAVRASGGVANEGISDTFLILGVPAEMAARKKAQEAAESTAAGLRRALEEVRCRCSRGIDNHCPECGDDLDRVVNNGPLNDDQFDAVKAGDWYCKKCKSDAAATGFKYWLDRQLPVVVYQTCDRCTALAASSDEHERRIKAEALRKAAEYATSAAVTLPLPDHTPTGEYVLYGDRCRVAVAHGLLAQADRLEKEAANENT